MSSRHGCFGWEPLVFAGVFWGSLLFGSVGGGDGEGSGGYVYCTVVVEVE